MCRYCGESIPTNSLSTHILKAHPRPGSTNLSPTLVRKHLTIVKTDVLK